MLRAGVFFNHEGLKSCACAKESVKTNAHKYDSVLIPNIFI